MGAGRRVSPSRKRSTAAAHERPSAMAHTMRLWPRPMSPATNTPSTLVAQSSSRATLPRSVELDAELVEQAVALGADEAHGQQHELARQLEVGALDLLEAAVDHLDLVGPQRPHVAVVVAEEALGVDREHPLAALLVGRRRAVHQRPRRPRGRVGPGVGRPRHDLELVDRRRALAVRGAEAVGAGVAAADDDDVLARRP